jgi:DNA polymerase IV (archaeal DinB-like DNA polymerase)
LKYYIGCSGWRYQTWREDGFYPSNLDPNKYLAYYSKVFDFVEVNLNKSSNNNNNNSNNDHKYNYPLPNQTIIKRWSSETPYNFRFTLNLPSWISIDTYRVGNFLEELAPLEEKILAIVIHQPPAFTLKDGREWLNDLLDVCTYHGYSVALEFDNYTWFQDLTYHILKKHKAALVWSLHNKSHKCHHSVVTGNFLYLKINENEMTRWVNKIKQEEKENEGRSEERKLDFAIMVVDKPEKVNAVLKLMGMPERKYDYAQWIGRIIMCVDLNAFFPACEELRDPSLIGKPHAVIMTDQPKDKITKGAVASCSYEARKYGVRSAMSFSKAIELCPSLILNPVDKPYYQQISQKIMKHLEEYSDILEQSSIDEAYLDCTNKLLLTASANSSISIEQYASNIKKSIKDQYGLLTSIGVAPTKSAAKIASDYQKPDGLTVIYPDKLQAFLQPLEVDRISGIGFKTQQVLKQEMGIKTIEQLAKQDVQRLIDRFGKKNGLWMWQVANGKDTDDVVIPREDNVSLSTERTLDLATKDKQKILQYLHKLVEHIYEIAVIRRRYEFRTVGIKLVNSDFSVETREISFSDYQNRKEKIASVIENLLDKFSFSNGSSSVSVRKVGIKLSNLVRTEKKKKPSTEQKTLLDYMYEEGG